MKKYEKIIVESRERQKQVKVYRNALRGRPRVEYKEEYAEQALKLCRDLGARIPDLENFFNVSQWVINRWRSEQEDFHNAIKKGMDIFDCSEVENTLLNRAKGYNYNEVKTEQITFKNKPKGIKVPAIKKTITIKHVPGDVTALMFYLQNRMKDRWKNTKYMNLTGNVEKTINHKMTIDSLRNMSKKDLMKMIKLYDKVEEASKPNASQQMQNRSLKL